MREREKDRESEKEGRKWKGGAKKKVTLRLQENSQRGRVEGNKYR